MVQKMRKKEYRRKKKKTDLFKPINPMAKQTV